MYLNKVLIVGNLTRDPELAAIPSGQKVCKFSVATNRVWKDKAGAKQESVTFHNVVVWGRQAETSAQYLKKGQQVMIEGRIETRSWDDKATGEKKYRTEIIADRVQFGSKGGGAGASTGGGATASAGKATASSGDVDSIEYPEEDISPEDIPF